MEYDVRPVTADLWDELAAFFGPSGAYSNCWCAWWRETSNEFSAGCASGGAGNREVLHKLTVDGRVPGLLAYPAGTSNGADLGHPAKTAARPASHESEPGRPKSGQSGADNRFYPLGWVSVGPRPDFGRINRSRNLKPAAADDFGDASVWSVVCFWIPRANRGKGIAHALLAAATSYAFEHGASAVEGYPVDTRGTRTEAASIFTGAISMFEAAGFKEVLRRADKRPVMRRQREL